MYTGDQSPECSGTPLAHDDIRLQSDPSWAGCLPDGLYVRDGPGVGDGEPTQDAIPNGQIRQWSITGRNPGFWWDLVITQCPAGGQRCEFHCTRCGHHDTAPSMDDVLRLIHFGAHFHNIDPSRELS